MVGDRPTIVSVSPADGEIGVTLDTDLVITFTKPMDRTSTEDAFLSQDIRAGGVTFTWNGNSTVLTINPTSDLTYAEVTSPNDETPNYAVSITDEAHDLSGNHLTANVDWSFRTNRRVTHAMPVPGANVYTLFLNGASSRCLTAGGMATVGDLGEAHNIMISADISELPSEIVEWEAASLTGVQIGVNGAPFGSGSDNLGVLHAYDVAVIPPGSVNFSTPSAGDVGLFSDSPNAAVKSLDVLRFLTDDYADRVLRGQRSQYRLRFTLRDANMNGIPDVVGFNCDDFTLTARYLIR